MPEGLAPVFRNLMGIPSYHYDPIFAGAVRDAFADFRPTVVALESPKTAVLELEWAAECWPVPMVSLSDGVFFPFVPGDSIFEAYRLARRDGIDIACIDLDVWRMPDDEDAASEEPTPQRSATVPGPELAPRLGSLFRETNDALQAAAGHPPATHLAREAFMAHRLFDLMERYERVLWVGGMAHWTRLVERIETSNFKAPLFPVVAERTFGRVRLAASALYQMTGRIPRLITRYVEDPNSYDEDGEIKALALAALQPDTSSTVAIVSLPGQNSAALDPMNLDREEGTPLDVARTLLYARNLALTAGLRERPDLVEVLVAAVSTIGSRYAGRVSTLAMEEHVPDALLSDPALSWEIEDDRQGYRIGKKWVTAEPWWPPQGLHAGISLIKTEYVSREKAWIPYHDLGPVDKRRKKFWGAYPSDEAEYERFVEYVLRRASVADPGDARSLPFLTGLRDGLDVRATIRHWNDGDLYVREEQRGQMNFRNGIIDWSSENERTPLLRGEVEGGWIDPDCLHVGSVSWEVAYGEELQLEPYLLQVDRREFSFITLDKPTRIERKKPGQQSMYDLVILPLLALKGTEDDNLYGWLDVMFAFCAGKPVAYYSRYMPSPRIHAVAARHRVQVMHVSLRQIPRALLERHRHFRFMQMTVPQWRELRRQMAEQGLWDMVATLKAHDT